MKTPTSFRTKVYNVAAKIPKGKVATYKQLARLAGSPNASRAVGMCMKENPDKKIVPCHRVVATNGHLAGYSFGKGVTTKKGLLIKEGVKFKGDRVDLGASLWKK